MPVQWVNRPHLDFRGFCGRVVSGKVKSKEKVTILPGGQQTEIKEIFITDKKVEHAQAGDSITITLRDELDCSRGQIITAADQPLEVADQFEATVIWMDEQEFLPGRPYFMKIGTQTVSIIIGKLKHKININSMEKIAAKQLKLNEIGVINLAVDQPIPFTSYKESRELEASF